MSLRLPLSSSPLRELFDVADLAKLGDTAEVRKLPTYREAITRGREFLDSCPMARSICYLALLANGTLVLARVTRANARALWQFGKVAP